MACNETTNCTKCVNQCNCPDPCAPDPCNDGCLIDLKDKCVATSKDITICGTLYPSGTLLDVIIDKLNECVIAGVPAANDVFVKISANDTTTAYLEDKLTGSNCLQVTKVNTGGNEELVISPKISAQSGNALQCLADGMFVQQATVIPNNPTIVNELDTNSIDTNVTFNGIDTYTVSSNLRLASGGAYTNNIAQIIAGNGLYVPPPVTSVPISILQCNTSTTITQTVTPGPNNYTICNEVNISSLIDGGGIDPTNCLTLRNNKLFVDCPTLNNNYVSNVNILNGVLDFSATGAAFGGNIDLISADALNGIIAGTDNALWAPGISADAGNALVAGTDSGLFVPQTATQIKVTVADTCPGTLFDKIPNDISTLSPTCNLKGVCGWTWPQVEIDVTCTGPNNFVSLQSIVIDGITYNNTSGISVSAISDVVNTIQWIIDNNPALIGGAVSSSSAGLPGIPPSVQDIYITGPYSTVVLKYFNCSSGVNSPLLTLDITSSYDSDLILPIFKTSVFKKVIDTGGGCEELELFTYKPEPEYKVLTSTNDKCPGHLSDKLVAGAGISLSASMSPLLCETLTIDLSTDPCDTPWTNIPAGAILNGWSGVNAQYKIKNGSLYFRGGITKVLSIIGGCAGAGGYDTPFTQNILEVSAFSCLTGVTAGTDDYGWMQISESQLDDCECGVGVENSMANVVARVTRSASTYTALIHPNFCQPHTEALYIPLHNFSLH